MRNKLGKLCVLAGTLLLCASLGLFVYNLLEARTAGEKSREILTQIAKQMPDTPSQEDLAASLTPPEFRDPESLRMTEVIIDGYACIGYLSLPVLDLNLPVMSGWDYEQLRIAPCRYSGSTGGEDLVLMAHNYATHFGRLRELQPGDTVIFTDMDGISIHYQVVSRDILAPEAIAEMTAGDFDLTLFTCTYGGENRVTVYCDRKENTPE